MPLAESPAKKLSAADDVGAPSSARRRLWRRLLLGLIAVIALAMVFIERAATYLVIDRPQKSPVMVVLNGEAEFRLMKAQQLLHEGYAPKVLIDVRVDEKIYGLNPHQLAQQYISSLPPEDARAYSICDIDALSTKTESRETLACVDRLGGGPVLLVTSDYHTRRSLSIFESQFPQRKFSIAAAYDKSEFGARWWTNREWAKRVVDEWLRLFWWQWVDRWTS